MRISDEVAGCGNSQILQFSNSQILPAPLRSRFGAIGLLFCFALPGQIPPLREQARIQQQWVARRLNDVLPNLMRKHGVPMWIVMMCEYN